MQLPLFELFLFFFSHFPAIIFGGNDIFCIFAKSFVTIRVESRVGQDYTDTAHLPPSGGFFYWVYRFINPITNFESIFPRVIDISLFPLKMITSADCGLSK